MFGTFTPESLKKFAEANGFNTKNVDFSEGIFDFKVCEKPNYERYGVPNTSKCNAPNKEVKPNPYMTEEQLININKRPPEIVAGTQLRFTQAEEKLISKCMQKVPEAWRKHKRKFCTLELAVKTGKITKAQYFEESNKRGKEWREEHPEMFAGRAEPGLFGAKND